MAHRRAGKTVSAVNDLIRGAFTSKSPNPLFGYIAPYRSQAKSVAWDYVKTYARPLIKSVNEADLMVELHNGAKIRLFGADNADAMRGLGFDGIYMDEYGDFRPSVWGNVIRPTLSDKQGWAVFGGTPKGKNQFWKVYQTAKLNPEDWYCLTLKASESGLLPEYELKDARLQISEDQYMQEYECSFEAAILGAYYGIEMRIASEDGRICKVDYDPALPTYTAWDLGYKDDTAIWWYQVTRGEVHIIDFYAVSGASINEIAKVVLDKPYHYEKHWLPHDAKAKTLAAQGKSIIEQLGEHLGIANMGIVPDLSVQDGIQAVRHFLPRCYFDEVRCLDGIEALRQYEREYDEDKKAFRATPKHNWCFTGDTKVLTRYGTQQIMDLPQSGEVLTSCGWKPYLHPRITRKDAPLVEVVFKDGLSVKCTPDHLFKTESGWISAECLTPGTAIQSGLTRSRNISMAGSTGFSLRTNISNAVGDICTGMLGALRSALFQMAATFIIGMETEPTTGSKILSAYRQGYTFKKPSKGSRKEHSISKRETLLLSGIDRTKGVFGISDTQNDQKAGLNGSESQRNVRNALSPLTRWSGSLGFLKSIVLKLAKLGRTESAGRGRGPVLVIDRVRNLAQKADVWCMTVPEMEEFCLENGALVHNCSHPADAFRMLAVAWREEPLKPRVPISRPLIVGPGNTATLNDMWAEQRRPKRVRI